MDVIRENWPYILIAIIVALIIAFIVFRPRQRVTLTDSAPVRPHMAQSAPAEGRGIPGGAAAAASDVAGELIDAPVRRELDNATGGSDDLLLLKGVGPRLATQLNEMGFRKFEQLARLGPTEVERLEERLGALRGRLTRDRVVEQADYLSRNDIDGYETRFGKIAK